MFRLFRKQKKKPITDEHSSQQRIADYIVSKILRLQRRWAGYMQRWSETFSTRSKRVILVLFCLCTGGYSAYIAVSSIGGKSKSYFSVTPIRTPINITRTGDENTKSSKLISQRDYDNILLFQKYMDSLSHTRKGRKIADSIMMARPGLADTIHQLEQLYQLQSAYQKRKK